MPLKRFILLLSGLFSLLPACVSDPVPRARPDALKPSPPLPSGFQNDSEPLIAAKPAEEKAEDVGSRSFWVDPSSEASLDAARLRLSQPKAADLMKKLAEQPTAVWLTAAQRDVRTEARRLAQASEGRYLSLVIRALERRDCRDFVSTGLTPDAYRRWLRELVEGLGAAPAYIVLEPDALLFTACLKAEARTERFKLLAEAVLELKRNPKAQVYIDAGTPGQFTIDELQNRLLQAGVLYSDGFALNVGSYEWTDDCIRFGQQLSQRIGGKGFVIDTGRNGKGPVSREAWCNPQGRAVGPRPLAPTGVKAVDAYLWLTKPGVSDGSCNGGPAAGQWWQAKAIELMRQAELPD